MLPPVPPLEQPATPQTISGNQSQPPKRIQLTLRDNQILAEFPHGRYYTVHQLLALHWRQPDGRMPTSPRAAQHRLQLLTQAGLLRVIKQRVQRGEGDLPYIYALDRAGAVLLSQQLGIDYADIDWKPKQLEENYIFLQHLLETHNLRIAITLSAQKLGVELSAWLYETLLRSKEWVDHVLLKESKDGKAIETRVSVIPDSFCTLMTLRGTGYFPIEIDRGTVTLARWRQKVQAYIEYHKSGEYQKRYQSHNFRLLVLTTSMARLMNLKEQCERVAPNDGRFWLTTFDKVMTKVPIPYKRPGSTKTRTSYTWVYNDDLLIAPVWYRSGSQELHHILE